MKAILKEEEDALKAFLQLIVSVTVELNDRMRSMFLPTAERCHYIFSVRDLGNVFKYVAMVVSKHKLFISQICLWFEFDQRYI